jgi:hypothetical protein
MRASVHRATFLGATLALAGCGTAPLMIDDPNAPSASVRGVVRVGEDKRGGIEAEWTRTRAEGTQITTAFTTVFGTEVPANTALAHTARADRLFLGYNRLLFGDRPFEMEWFAGAAGERIAWTTAIAGATSTLASRQSAVGLSGGVLGRWKFHEAWALDARVRGVTGNINGVRAELALSVRPVRPLRVRAGYAYDEINTRVKDAATRLELKSRGPFLGLGLELD